MSKVIKVIIEYDDKIQTVEGEEAEIWLDNANACANIAAIHNLNPFDRRPTMWSIQSKSQNTSDNHGSNSKNK